MTPAYKIEDKNMEALNKRGRTAQTQKLGADILRFLGYDPESEWDELWLGIRGPDLEDARVVEKVEGDINDRES